MAKFDTLCVRAGYNPKSGDANVTPIVQSTTFTYETAQDMADLFDLKKDGFFYTRLSNPTNRVLEQKMAAIDDGVGAIACASGMSATLLSILNVCNSGDNIISSNQIYGGTFNLFKTTLPKYGIVTKFVDPNASFEEINKLVDEHTKIIFAETISNPTIVVLDFDKWSKVAKDNNILFFVDNTLSTPALIKVKDFGADVALYSSSKYLDGHAVALGGIIVDLGTFNFKNNKRYPEFNVPDESYHGLVYADLNKTAFITKCLAQMIRDLGAIMSPMNAFLTNLGIETLGLRMERTVSNAEKVAKFLSENKNVEWIHHPSLKTDPYYGIANKYMPKGVTGMMAFGVKGGRAKAVKFMENLKMIKMVTHVADSRTCVLHPASTTHRQLSDLDLKKAGIPDNLIRLSVGIDDVEDIINDLSQALENI